MARVAITESYLEDIADAIRNKTGMSSATYYPSEMADAIMTISGGGGITPTGTISITENGTYNVTSYASADVEVPTGSEINNQDKTVNPTTSQQSITADSGYTGLGTVTVSAMPTMTLPTSSSASATSGYTSKATISRSTSDQYINIPTGYNSTGGYYKISAVANGSATGPSSLSGSSATVTTGTNTITLTKTGVTTTPTVSAGYVASATASTATVALTANVTTKSAATITPGTTNQTIASGTYLTGTQTIAGSSNLVAGNIKKNVTIFGVTGSYEASSTEPTIEELEITPSESEQTFNSSDVDGYKPVSVSAISTTYVGSGITRRSSTDLTVSDATVTIPAGYYSTQSTKSVSDGSYGSQSSSFSKTSSVFYIEPTWPSFSAGYFTNAPVATSVLSIENKTVTPTESSQVVTPKNNNYYLNSVTIEAISSTYIGSGITQRDSDDLTASGATVTAPAGYYESAVSKSVTTMTLPTAAASSATSGYTSKATISRSTSDQYINIAPGYNSAGGYYKISAVANGSATPAASISGTSATITTGTNTITLTKSVSNTPQVTAGYVSSGTAGNSSVSLTASVTVDPTPTASGATVTIPAGYYTEATSKAVSTMTLPTSASSSATSGYTKKATISRSTSAQYINIAPGYNSAGGYYEISAVANGSASAPTSISGTTATVSTGTNTLTFTKTVSVTPVVSAGYVSSGTATNSSVSLTASVTTKAAATITPGTTDQTIASGTYLTGTQTIAGDADLVASNIVSGVQIFGVTGNVVLQNYYTGSSAPSSSLGQNGDIYIQQ